MITLWRKWRLARLRVKLEKIEGTMARERRFSHVTGVPSTQMDELTDKQENLLWAIRVLQAKLAEAE